MGDPEDPGSDPVEQFFGLVVAALAFMFLIIPGFLIAVVLAGEWTVFLLERLFG